ncbi:NAD(P)H-hydrate dehydratase [Anaerobium acetethylicum]|uniref:Bifunctional NAD(P)H-hydrate repair enzyme n=1 Tax=Anaerobium acetethylicum TaxID=1619234 RepID=A0A1D3TP63_9FIRM|nr:NAD(P)H-hydrate dehydratase [Anaerobium acetethylicum]SCP95162.1 NAD(P)H-hydrate epimerase [Anaerobium acetethylicum]
MKYLVNSSEMKRCDKATIEKIGVPSMVLMERAALSIVEELENGEFNLKRILIVCGAGNNGGDGFAAARLLFLKGYEVDVAFIGDEDRLSEDAGTQMALLKNHGKEVENTIPDREYTTVVDALFGIGLNTEISGRYAEAVDRINSMDARVLAADIPSGVSADTGQVLGTAVKADVTAAFAYKKLGQVLYPGAVYCGRTEVRDIGITDLGFEGILPKVYTYDESDLKRIPDRRPYSNKGTYGKILIIAGSCNMSGAAYLAAKAAYRTGAGLVRIYTPSENREILQTMLPEAILSTYDRFHIDVTAFKEIIGWADVIGIGPGIGKGIEAKTILNILLGNAKVPVIIDADGINLVSEHIELLENHKQDIILTPHLGEMSRLLKRDIKGIAQNLLAEADEFARKHHVVCVLKDARTVVADGTGAVYMNQTGNNGMATGGSGDVLTGIIIGLLSQNTTIVEAATLGVLIHGMAGDIAAENKGQYSMMAHDIIDSLADIVR